MKLIDWWLTAEPILQLHFLATVQDGSACIAETLKMLDFCVIG